MQSRAMCGSIGLKLTGELWLVLAEWCRFLVCLTGMIVLSCWSAFASSTVDLSKATVCIPEHATLHEQTSARMLVEEVERRTGLHWQLQTCMNGSGPIQNAETITLGTTSELNGIQISSNATKNGPMLPESFRIKLSASVPHPSVLIEGHDDRGVLFGVGFLLRQMEMRQGSATLEAESARSNEVYAPAYAVRGHQLGYRPKNNTFDGWTAAQFEQYIRDLAVFGTNTIELIPPRSDDVPSSPLYTLPPLAMMQAISATLDRYGLDCSIWYPAMDKDYSDPATVDRAVAEWGVVFRALSRVDAVFVPGGDPGHTEPKYLFRLLEREAIELHKTHPHAQMWVSPQSFDAAWLDQFYQLLDRHPKWLTGVVYGPEMRVSLEEFRKRIPRDYPIRLYPDITHTLSSQYPVPDWDPAFALTEGREPINPEPVQQGILFHRYMPLANGFVTYSEGSNDDVNKILWSSWGWDPGRSADAILEEYARYFLSPAVAQPASRAISELEQDWHGPVSENFAIPVTLSDLQQIDHELSSVAASNWRIQQLLYRANYDAYVQQRVLHYSSQESRAIAMFKQEPDTGIQTTMENAKAALAGTTGCEDSFLCVRAENLASDLFRTIKMQLSVARFGALATDRGANLDRIDAPISDVPWLREQLAKISVDPSNDIARSIHSILEELEPNDRLVDDLGLFGRHPHLVEGSNFYQDPSGLTGVYFSVGTTPPNPAQPLFLRAFAGTLYEYPLTMHYSELKPGKLYELRASYPSPGDSFIIRANGKLVEQRCDHPGACLNADADIRIDNGDLTLEWTAPPGLGGNGRRVKVSRVELDEVP
jgi:hypothetical protein